MSCLQDKPKPRVPLKTLDIIFRRRYVKNTQFYFTDRKHAVKQKGTTLHPFGIPKSEKLLSYLKYSDRIEKWNAKNRLGQPLFLKDNMNIAATRDISKRLFIDPVPNDVRAIVDVHPEFYGVIEGRPVRCFDDIKIYIANLRDYAMVRNQIGFRQDLVYSIKQSIAEETLEHDRIVEQFRQHVKNFQKFLTEDYKKASAKISKAEKIHAELLAKNSEFVAHVSNLTNVNNILFKLDAIRNVLKVYRSFLMFIAPLSWRQQNDETLRGRVQSIQFESGEFMTDNDTMEALDIDKMIDFAKSELGNPLPVRMHFKTPEELMYLFRTMELQSREYLIHLSYTNVPFRMLQNRIRQLKQATKQEFDYFQYYIDNINNKITRENINEANLRDKFFRILNKTFFDNVASAATLKLKICVEYVYEQVIGKCDEGHQSILDPMRILEVMYEDYNLRLDSLDFNIVNQARNDCFAQDLKTLHNAFLAQRELRAFREMTDAMHRSFQPGTHYTRRKLKKFIRKKDIIVLQKPEQENEEIEVEDHVKSKKYKISEEEKEALMLFTEWCEGMDPTPYLLDYNKFVKSALEVVPQSQEAI